MASAPTAPASISVPPLLDWSLLLLQKDLFKSHMEAWAPRYERWEATRAEAKERGKEEPCATDHLWAYAQRLPAVLDSISEYAKLAELAQVQPTGSVANERKFSDMNNLKAAIRNRLQTPHLNVCMPFTAATTPTPIYPLSRPLPASSPRRARPVRGSRACPA